MMDGGSRKDEYIFPLGGSLFFGFYFLRQKRNIRRPSRDSLYEYIYLAANGKNMYDYNTYT